MKKRLTLISLLFITLPILLCCKDKNEIEEDVVTLRASEGIDPYLPDPGSPAEIDGYVYVWGDEFNGNILTEDIWDFEKGFVRGNELQYYQKDNASVSDGRLLISGRKERVRNEFYDASSNDYRKNTEYSEYTSSSLIGKNKRHFLFGRIEVRAKIDPANGSFPAIWTCGYNKNWPKNGEIDIMEYYLANLGDGDGKIPVLTSNFCVGGDPSGSDGEWSQKWKSVFTKQSYYENKYNDLDWINKYHIFRMDWDENQISLYVDDELRNSININDFKNFDGSITFLNPQFMMLNLAIKNHGNGVAENCKFEIDYFRVYQKIVDIEKPSLVKDIEASNISTTICTLNWNESIDNIGVYRYDIYKNGMADGYFVGSTTSTNYTIRNLTPGTSYNFYVRALDKSGNYSDIPAPLSVVTSPVNEYTGDCSLTSTGSNLVPDGTMENLPTELNSDLGSYGFSGSWGNASWGTLRITSGMAYCGNKCVELKPEGGDLVFPVSWKTNQTYILRALIKTTGDTFEFSINNAFVGGNKNNTLTIPNSLGKWMLFEQEFTSGNEAQSGSCSFHAWWGEGIAYIDNWELYEKQ